MSEEKTKWVEAMDLYYQMKDAYQSAFHKEKNVIIKNGALSWKEKRRAFSKIHPKCVNCKRRVGTNFYTAMNEGERTIGAKCGDKTSPCPLKIEINVGYNVIMTDLIREQKKDINVFKKKVIVAKNALLFDYITATEAVHTFDALKKSIETTSQFFEYTSELYKDLVENEERETRIRELTEQYYSSIESLKQLIKQFKESNEDVQYIQDAVDIYVTDLQKGIEEKRTDLYAYMAVEYNEEENIYTLVQTPFAYSLDKREIDLGDKQSRRVVSLHTGTTQRQPASQGTQRIQMHLDDGDPEEELDEEDEEDDEEEEEEEEEEDE